MANVRSTYTDCVNFYGQEDPRELVARFGSPLYVYNENVLRACCRDGSDGRRGSVKQNERTDCKIRPFFT